MNLTGPRLPSSSGWNAAPSRLFFSIARACIGMSGRVVASGAGDRSSVLVSPGTLKTVIVRLWGSSGRLVNHSASAQLCSTARALALPLSAFSFTSWKESNISRVLQRLGGDGADFSVVQQFDQRANVVAAEHGAQQFGRLGAADQRTSFLAQRHGGQVRGLDLGGVVHASRHAMRQQLDQVLLLAGGRVLQQFDQFGGLFGRQGQRGSPGPRARRRVDDKYPAWKACSKSGWKKGYRTDCRGKAGRSQMSYILYKTCGGATVAGRRRHGRRRSGPG